MENNSIFILKNNNPYIITEHKTNYCTNRTIIDITLRSLQVGMFQIQLNHGSDSVELGIIEICQHWMSSSRMSNVHSGMYKIYIEVENANSILLHSRVSGFFGKILNMEWNQRQTPTYTSTGILLDTSTEIVILLKNIKIATKSDLLEYLL